MFDTIFSNLERFFIQEYPITSNDTICDLKESIHVSRPEQIDEPNVGKFDYYGIQFWRSKPKSSVRFDG